MSPPDTPIGAILREYATERSYQDCQARDISAEDCKARIAAEQQHLDSVNARIDALLKDPRTNRCDMVRFLGRCEDPRNMLGDLADCLQVTPDREEAINSGRVAFNLDSRGCPTSNQAIPVPPELTGIWATEGAELKDGILSSGVAIYLDSDGRGRILVGQRSDVLGTDILFTNYDPPGENLIGTIGIDVIENGKVTKNLSLIQDTRFKFLSSAEDGRRYYRRADALSPAVREEIGLTAAQR
ncbi:MAG: hypothetical protein JSS29_19870 [Proteobacteria bacterium]|nr:hypothetical protein [Pseudomonadota bacterium]